MQINQFGFFESLQQFAIIREVSRHIAASGYEADRKTLIKSSQHNPILKTLYEKLPPEKAHELLHVHYPQPE